MENKITILYAEDKEKFRRMIVEDLKPFNIHTIGEADNGFELLDLMKRFSCDVVLLDIEMPLMDGNKALTIILEKWPETKVIMVSWHFEYMLVEHYISRGAKGYVSKDDFCGKTDILVDAIRKVVDEGKTVVQGGQKVNVSFTKKQKEIVPFILQGFTNEQIAKALGIQERAIEKRRKGIYMKFGGKLNDFLKYAYSKGLQFLEEKPPPD